MKEEVNHPERYGGDTVYECIKVLEAWLPPEQYKGFLRGNALKYLCRVGKKDNTVQELKKELNSMLLGKNQQPAKAKEIIEKMKCCENCRHYSHTYGHCYSYDEYQNCKSLSNWRLAEC